MDFKLYTQLTQLNQTELNAPQFIRMQLNSPEVAELNLTQLPWVEPYLYLYLFNILPYVQINICTIIV